MFHPLPVHDTIVWPLFLHPFQQKIMKKTACLCLADLQIAYKVDHLPADLFLQCPTHDVGMRVQGISIVIPDVDGFVVKEKYADDTFISSFRKNVDLPSGREEVPVDIVAETIVGTAFADDGLPHRSKPGASPADAICASVHCNG